MEIITKTLSSQSVKPNLSDYWRTHREFSWGQMQLELSGLPEGRGLNIAYEVVDRHAFGKNEHRVAIKWLSKTGETRDYTYKQLRTSTNKFANVLETLGVKPVERVFTLTGRIPELYIAALGSWKHKNIFCPLFSAFSPEPILQRMSKGNAKVLLTTSNLYQRKIARIKNQLPQLKHILLTDASDHLGKGLWSLQKLMSEAQDEYSIPPTHPEDNAILHFTSGTSGKPKGALQVHNAVLSLHMTGKYVLDFHPGDVYWCTADPGWVTGTSYGIIAPLAHGITSVIDESGFDAERWYHILSSNKVNIWYTSPTAIRSMMRTNFHPKGRYDLSHLRLVHSVGEPLNPEAIKWGQNHLGLPIHDNWWQTETGGIIIANYPSTKIKPGSMGLPVPGIEAAIFQKDDNQKPRKINSPGTYGELAIKASWPSMFRGYIHDEARYRKCFSDDWYLTGDLAMKDEEGYYWFIGRTDEVIRTSGHLVGPFKLESALMEHPKIAEAAVIGKPDPVTGQLVKAFVSLNSGETPSEALKLEILGFARKKLGPAIAPKEVAFLDVLPKTKSGKIMRRLLKARELGLPEGDISTLEF